MGQRIVFEFSAPPETRDAAWRRVCETLEAHGASHVRPPEEPLPEIATAVLPSDVQPEPVLEELRSLEGVGRAEIDAARGTY